MHAFLMGSKKQIYRSSYTLILIKFLKSMGKNPPIKYPWHVHVTKLFSREYLMYRLISKKKLNGESVEFFFK